MPKFARIINNSSENIYVAMNSVQWVREIHDGENSDRVSLSVYFSGSTEESALQLQDDAARKFLKYMDLGG